VNLEHPEHETTRDHPEVSGVVAAGDPDVTMEVLRSHVPLTLLMDIGSAEGPDSERIAAIEGGDADWLTRAEPKAGGGISVTAAD
jgi:hypothetical protein